ncbi:MAG: hypothetical protein IIC75_09290 [Bacteroidetes bacterium]|nr:hypothetical protein [Bacteroidota bacterium]
METLSDKRIGQSNNKFYYPEENVKAHMKEFLDTFEENTEEKSHLYDKHFIELQMRKHFGEKLTEKPVNLAGC